MSRDPVEVGFPGAAASPANAPGGHGFGTMPVFLAGISTILGAIMFLRFDYAVGNVGLVGVLGIIALGHLVTIPTALALAEIATNRRVEGGGEYFIISRSFGTTIGSVIGISLYLSQAISVAFYMIAFAEAFWPVAPWIQEQLGLASYDPRIVSLPASVLLFLLVLVKGASLGVKALYVVVLTLAVSLVLFFLGSPTESFAAAEFSMSARIVDADPFIVVFAICFPAFTGMTAGVGLSGDLANPRTSLPRGTLLATFVGMFIYIAIVAKLALSASPEELASGQLTMASIALWGPMIFIGLGAATLSSAIGSILVAPRTLQALGADESIPIAGTNRFLARGRGRANEPRNATLVTSALALVIVSLGNVDVVARLISMFFMVTYGSLCAISFLESFAARPSYRPVFRSRWYISLFGAAMCVLMMFQMDPLYAVAAIVAMLLLYRAVLSRSGDESDDIAAMFQGVMTQLTRYIRVRLQANRPRAIDEWRPSVIMVNERTFDRRAPLEFLRWLCHRIGFGTYLHFIKGHLNAESFEESQVVKERLVKMAKAQNSSVYMDTIVSPSMISALAQSLQVPGVSGLSNNTALFELSEHDAQEVGEQTAASCLFASSTDMTLLVLRHSDLHFREHREIHIWVTWNDRRNANLMILLSYILLGHPDWADAEIRVFAALPQDAIQERSEEFLSLMAEGRIPISEKNVQFLAVNDLESYRSIVRETSRDADLTIIGFDIEGLRERGRGAFMNHPDLHDVLFVHAAEEIDIA